MTATKSRGAVWNWLSTNGLAVMLIGSLVANAFQYQQMRENQRLSYRYQQIENFKETGADLDEIVATYFDALADGDAPPELKEKFDGLYRKHVIRTEADREILGVERTEHYLTALGVLRDEIDASKGPTGAGQRIEAFAQVISARRSLSEEALET